MPGKVLDRFEEIVISVFLALATLISFLQVVLRYGFAFSFTWAAELSTFLLIWAALIGASYGVRRKIHIGVDTFVNMLPEKWFRVSVIATSFISLVYTITLCWLGTFFIRFLIKIGQVSPDLELPMWIVFFVVPLGNAMMTVRFIQQAIADIKTPPEKKAVTDVGEMPPLLRDTGGLEDRRGEEKAE